jgi:hypothetical protein
LDNRLDFLHRPLKRTEHGEIGKLQVANPAKPDELDRESEAWHNEMAAPEISHLRQKLFAEFILRLLASGLSSPKQPRFRQTRGVRDAGRID